MNKRIVPFKAKSHNEYTRLMKCVYEYGRNPEPTAELTIGNMTRRVLEAFSTFTFKEGPDKVSLNPQVLALIPDQNKRAYFQNSMYRLVLNTESHLQEAVQGAPEMSFFSHLTVEEKQRTARDVLCFMYCVNPAHVLAHLPNARKQPHSSQKIASQRLSKKIWQLPKLAVRSPDGQEKILSHSQICRSSPLRMQYNSIK